MDNKNINNQPVNKLSYSPFHQRRMENVYLPTAQRLVNSLF